MYEKKYLLCSYEQKNSDHGPKHVNEVKYWHDDGNVLLLA